MCYTFFDDEHNYKESIEFCEKEKDATSLGKTSLAIVNSEQIFEFLKKEVADSEE